MAKENHKPRNTIRLDGISPRSRVLDAILLNVASSGFPRWIRTGQRAIDIACEEDFASNVIDEIYLPLRDSGFEESP